MGLAVRPTVAPSGTLVHPIASVVTSFPLASELVAGKEPPGPPLAAHRPAGPCRPNGHGTWQGTRH